MPTDTLLSLTRGVGAANQGLVAMEKKLLSLLLLTILVLSFGQILLRYCFSMGFVWIDQVLRVCVLWIAFAGASLATEYNGHIKIDVIHHLAGAKHKIAPAIAGRLFFAGVCLVLLAASVEYMIMTVEEGRGTAIPGVSDWCLKVIIPYCFFMMAVRALLQILSLISPSQAGQGKTSQK
ncbi:MAG: TRAP transporter small permease [Desulfobacter sp.]|nr:MAG: TRAP transporter small permease [Desulfobacter sp.]